MVNFLLTFVITMTEDMRIRASTVRIWKMVYRAQDVMTEHPISLRPEMTCDEAVALFRDNRLTGAPVVDSRGVLVGVLSLPDLLGARAEIDYTETDSDELTQRIGEPGFHLEPLEGLVSDYMTRAVQTAFPDTPVEILAQTMLDYRIHRIIILRQNEQIPVGIVSSFDLLKILARDIPSASREAKAAAV